MNYRITLAATPHLDDHHTVFGKVSEGLDIIEMIGYHVRDYFVEQADRFSDIPGGVMAHSTHVRGVGTYIDGVEQARIVVTLATGISEETCKKINLGYRDPESIKIDDFIDREDEGILYVPKAGEMLYRLNTKNEGLNDG